MSYQANIREKYELWVATMRAMPDAEDRPQLHCPDCGRELGSFIGRHGRDCIVMHWPCNALCRREFIAGHGATPEEALRAFDLAAPGLRTADHGRSLPTNEAGTGVALSIEDVNAALMVAAGEPE